MHFSLDRTSVRPLYRQLTHEIQQRIRSGALPPGARLPPVRELAQQLGVTRLTVHSAYSELQAGGWVEATVGRGTFVAVQRDAAPAESDLGHELSHHGMIRDMLRMSQMPGMRSLAMADPAADLYPAREFARALEEALAHDPAAVFGYTSSQGEPLLRTVVAELLRGRGLRCGPDELLITSGVTQGLALVARTLARPGDTVIVEQPTYVGAINVLARQGLRVLGVPVDEHGLLVEALEPLLIKERPKLIYVIPAFQNPSGVCMSLGRRAALLALAERYRVPIVEDDIYAPIGLDRAALPALKAADQSDLVIYISSFSKSLLPGVRIGYLAASPALIKRIVAAKQADDLCSPPLLQRAMALFVERGQFTAHLRRVLPHYRDRRDAMLDAMARYFPSTARWNLPEGGFSVWVRLPYGISTTDLYLAAIDRGVAFAPGDFFFPSPPAAPFIRLSYSSQSPQVIREVTAVIGELLGTQLHRRSFSAPALADYVPLV
ncbi:MAG: PLP-dependent aminotransferase family protein [Roseiflexaceae bacterium]|nr:PLP-dependent aminotransferase family protein [Roseiflexaceae bacterium]